MSGVSDSRPMRRSWLRPHRFRLRRAGLSAGSSAALSAGLLVSLLAAGPGAAGTAETRSMEARSTKALSTASRSDAAPDRTALPAVLAATDAERYRRIFALQDSARWKEADTLIGKLEDPLLMGHVLYQRYMHPDSRKYRAKYGELKGWLREYFDHPGAKRVWKLARRRGPARGLKRPRLPKGAGLTVAENRGTNTATKRRGRRITRTEARVRNIVYKERPTQALRYLHERRRKIRPLAYDRARAIIVRGYYHAEKDREALAVAAAAIRRSGTAVPLAFWWGGLAAWRTGDYALAARYFGALADGGTSSRWLRSAAAYWAARAHLRNREPHRVNGLLRLAATEPRTFYGILALRTLGEKPVFDWTLPALEAEQTRLLLRVPAARRAAALIEAGQDRRAETELMRLVDAAGTELKAALLALAVHNGIAGLQYRIALRSGTAAEPASDALLYPIPRWQPDGGFTVDRALVFAMIRQESAFKTSAKSRDGACGVMQILPSSAHFIDGKRMPRSRRNCRALALMEPEANMRIGQKYLHHLFEFPGVDGNLLYATIAYNGGPGNLRRWRSRTEYRNDPLLFIESVPARESRDHVERVLTNLWIYRHRFAEPAPSLDALAEGNWPIYESVGEIVSPGAMRNEAPAGGTGRAN